MDWGGHSNSAKFIQGEMQSLNELIHFALDYQEKNPEIYFETLIESESYSSIEDIRNIDLEFFKAAF